MIYQGKHLFVQLLEQQVAQLCFDNSAGSVNLLNQATLSELSDAIAMIAGNKAISALIVTSAKAGFVLGADITEFTPLFHKEEAVLLSWLEDINQIFSRLEDLPIPTVAAINGLALGGGFETCLACDYRIMSPDAQIGLPEVKLGIMPGFGGTVRLSRLIGSDNALEWMCSGKMQTAQTALQVGAVDAIVETAQLKTAAIKLAQQCSEAVFDYRAKRQQKLDPLKLNPIEAMMAFESAKAEVQRVAGPHYPAPVTIVKTVQKHADCARDKALHTECRQFVKLAKTDVAASLIGLFLHDQALKKDIKHYKKQALPVNQVAVLGAGIMGGGIAGQCARKGSQVVMKDIQQSGIDLGLTEIAGILNQAVQRKRLNTQQMAEVLNRITTTLEDNGFATVQLAIEAVVEQEEIKQSVLVNVESQLNEAAILTSNTSTLSINRLAAKLQRPEQFCGMHFFNPVHKMPLIEVIRGEKTNEQTVATVVQYAHQLGKKPIVVNDCPGFFVNRVLFAYLSGAIRLIQEGVDFQHMDQILEHFGWPMGPAHLLDVIGMDTAWHAQNTLAQGFPERMAQSFTSAIQVLFEHQRLGQKNNLGFYRYESDKKGKLQKLSDPQVYELLEPHCAKRQTFTEDAVIQRVMIPLCLETVRCLQEGIVQSATDANMGLIYGIGFPPFLGGICHWMEQFGLTQWIAQAEDYAHLGPLYTIPDALRRMAENQQTFAMAYPCRSLNHDA